MSTPGPVPAEQARKMVWNWILGTVYSMLAAAGAAAVQAGMARLNDVNWSEVPWALLFGSSGGAVMAFLAGWMMRRPTVAPLASIPTETYAQANALEGAAKRGDQIVINPAGQPSIYD